MKIYCLSGDPNCPCFVLSAKGCSVMLDCALNMKPTQYFLPQMLVPNQRFDNMPNFRTPSGNPMENAKEFNNRVFLSSSLQFSPPQFELINVEELDAILISNFDAMLALPYLSRMKGFRAPIYCTEPIMHLGRILMEELIYYIKNNQSIQNSKELDDEDEAHSSKYPLHTRFHNLVPENTKKQQQEQQQEAQPDQMIIDEENSASQVNFESNPVDSNSSWKQFSSYLANAFNISESHLKPQNWKSLYTKEDVELCLSKMKLVDFNEQLSIFGSLTVHPKSSGYTVGSCNWTIEADSDTILYMAKSSILNTHSKLFNPNFLKQQIVDCMLITRLNQTAMCEPEKMVQEFCKACVFTLKNQGSVLIPTLPTGKIYDLIDCLFRYLNDANLMNIPVYFVSSFANQSLAYSNIFAEWLNETLQNYVYAADSPFSHADLVRNGFLKIYPAINAKFNDDFHQPCVLFASHPSLRFGEACHFVELWKNSPANSFIFTEPEFNYLDALAPFQPIYANFYYFPIDTSLNTSQAHKLLKETKHISQLVLSAQYKLSNNSNNDQTAKIDPSRLNANTNYYSQNDVIKVELKRKYENCEIEAELAGMIVPIKNSTAQMREISERNLSNVAFATFNAQLVTKNNRHVLKAAPRTIPLTRRDRLNESNLKKYAYGKLSLESLLNVLRQAGFIGLRIVSDEKAQQQGKFLIELDKANRIDVDLNANQIQVACENEDWRVKVKDCLLKCLNTL